MSESAPSTFDVAIVGYGPVGALLASLLGREGVRTVVVERDREIYRLPRAVHFDHEIMRIFQSVGIADELAEARGVGGRETHNKASMRIKLIVLALIAGVSVLIAFTILRH